VAFVNRTVFFDGFQSSDADGVIVTYDWSFGDGTSAFGITTSHRYTREGIYQVYLTVQDDEGAKNSDSVFVTVEGLPLSPEVGVEEGLGANEVNHVVYAVEEADTILTVNTTSAVTVSVLKYPDNPYPDVPVPMNALPDVVDIAVSNSTAVEWPIYVERHYSDEDVIGREESRLGIYYYMDGAWHRCRETGVYEEINIVWARMYRDEVTGSPTIIGEPALPAIFELSSLEISPSQIEVGEEVKISANINNVGGESGSYIVNLNIGGVIEESQTITLEGGSSSTVSFFVVKDVADTYMVDIGGQSGKFRVVRPKAPAEFKLSFLTVMPSQPEPGQDVKVSVIVSNEGEESGEYTLELMVDGSFIESKSILLGEGESTAAEFTIYPEDEGMHSIEINDRVESFTVAARELPPPTGFSMLFLIELIAIIVVAIIAYFLHMGWL
jgi:PKD repeat protein